MTGLCDDACINRWLNLQVGDVLDDNISDDPVYKYVVGADLNPDERTQAVWTTLRQLLGDIRVDKVGSQYTVVWA